MSHHNILIHCTCPICGDQTVKHTDVTLRIWPGKKRQELNRYEFACPQCGDTVTKPADGETIAKLVAGHVNVVRAVIPDEMDDVARDGAPLTVDWVLDTLLTMHATAWAPDLKEFA